MQKKRQLKVKSGGYSEAELSGDSNFGIFEFVDRGVEIEIYL